MIFLLYGPDEYRLVQKLKEIISRYVEKYGSFLVVERIDLFCEQESLFWDNFHQTSLFSQRKVIVVENVFSNPIAKKEFLKKLNELSTAEHIIFFIEKKAIKEKDSFLMALKEKGKVQEFAFLTGKKLEAFAREQVALAGSTISDEALNIILSQTKNNTWLLFNELQKLVAFKKEITENDIYILAKPNIEIEIFKTIDAILTANKKEALKAQQRYFDSKESLFYLLSMLAFQARNLLLVKLAQTQHNIQPQALGMHPFVFKKASQVVRNVPLNKLQDLMKKIFLADLEIKTGLKSPEQSIKSLAVSI